MLQFLVAARAASAACSRSTCDRLPVAAGVRAGGRAPEDPVARYRTVVLARLRWFAIGIPAVVALIAGLSAQADWQTVQLFLNSTPFGVTDPVFGNDIGFYAFQLPFYRWLLDWLFVAIAVSFVAALVAHYLFGGIRLAGRNGAVAAAARAHLAVLAGMFVLLKAVAYFFDRYELLFSDRKAAEGGAIFFGATYTDLNAVMPAKLILLFISVICAAAFFAAVLRRNLQIPAIALALLVLSSVLVGAAWPAVLQQFSVRAQRQRPRGRVDLAQHRGDPAGVRARPTSASSPTPALADRRQRAVRRRRRQQPGDACPTSASSTRAARRTFTQLSSDGTSTASRPTSTSTATRSAARPCRTTSSPRASSTRRLIGNQKDWINRHLVYTHGNGLVVGPGQPGQRRGWTTTAARAACPQFTGHRHRATPGRSTCSPTARASTTASSSTRRTTTRSSAADRGRRRRASTTARPPEYTYTGPGGVLARQLGLSGWSSRGLRRAEHPVQRLDQRELEDHVRPQPGRAGPEGRAVADAPTPTRTRRWSTGGSVDRRRLHDAAELPVRPAGRRSAEATSDSLQPGATPDRAPRLHAQLGEGHRRRLQRQGRRSTRSTSSDPVLQTWMKALPGRRAAAVGDQPEPAGALPVPGGPVQGPARAADPLPRRATRASSSRRCRSGTSRPTRPPTSGAAGAPHPPYYLLAGDPRPGATPDSPVPADQRAGVLSRREFLSAYVSASSDPATYGQITVLQLPARDRRPQTLGPQQVQAQLLTQPVGQRRAVNLLRQRAHRQVQYGNLLTLPVAGGLLYVEPVYIERQRADLVPAAVRRAGPLQQRRHRLRADAAGRAAGGVPGRAARRRGSASRAWAPARVAAAAAPGVNTGGGPLPRRPAGPAAEPGAQRRPSPGMNDALDRLRRPRPRGTSRGIGARRGGARRRGRSSSGPPPGPRRPPPRRPTAGRLTGLLSVIGPTPPPRRASGTGAGVPLRTERSAGWSSSVARWAHNPEVTGSNPVPATTPVPEIVPEAGIPSPGSRARRGVEQLGSSLGS